MDLVEREGEGAVAVLALNRPDRRNALSAGVIDALAARLDEAEADPAVRVVILTGRGKAFCAGGDLGDGLGGDGGLLASHAGRGRYAELLAGLTRRRVPVIAALNGDALGGGLGLAAACDLVVADPDAWLGTPEIKLGLFPWIILAVLQRHVPRKHLMEMVLTGAKLDAERARELGLVNRISAPGEVMAAAHALAAEIAAQSPAIVALGKSAFYRVSDLDFEPALHYLHSQLTLNLMTEDAAEGVAAFLSRRVPQWKGR